MRSHTGPDHPSWSISDLRDSTTVTSSRWRLARIPRCEATVSHGPVGSSVAIAVFASVTCSLHASVPHEVPGAMAPRATPRSASHAVIAKPGGRLTRGPTPLALLSRVLALHMRYTRRVRFSYEIEQEDDGRWLVEILELPGCMAYGSSADDALRAAQVLAFRILADRLEHREQAAVPDISFVQAA